MLLDVRTALAGGAMIRPSLPTAPAKPRSSARAEHTGAAGRLSLVMLATIALVILCLTACGDSSTAPRCRTNTRADSIAIVAGADTVAWWPVTVSVTVCR
jgi:hypothetical protein